MNTIDFSNIQQDVMTLWETQGKEYLEYHFNTGRNLPPEGFTETSILPWAQIILDSIDLCLEELGFDSIASYIQHKEQ